MEIIDFLCDTHTGLERQGLTDEHPAEIKKFWVDAGSGLKTVEAFIKNDIYKVKLYSKYE